MDRGRKTKFLLRLRKWGLLCRKKVPYKPNLKIQRSIGANGEIISHKDFMFAKAKLQGISKNNKDKKLCHYNFQSHTCRCGINLKMLKNDDNCPLK